MIQSSRSSVTPHPTARFGLLLATLGLAACKNGPVIVGSCQDDSECPANFHCATSGLLLGECLCSNDSACPQDAGTPVVCNPSGFCQVKIGCVTNADCNNQGYCDTVVQECVTGSGCSTDLDCPIGQICDLHETMCVPGCHTNGDCPLQEPCTCSTGLECACPPDAGGTFVDPATYDRSTCEVGACRPDTCAGDTSLCPYNDTCFGKPDGGLSVCERDPRMQVLCQDCSGQIAGSECALSNEQGANFCLIDPHESNLFCGVDCSQGQSCPSGYECDDVIVLTSNLCTSDASCLASKKISCTPGDGGTGCPTDTQCVGSGSAAQCGGFCAVNEGDPQGYCTCVADSDCPQDACEPTTATCRISQQPCQVGSGGDAFCRSFITCVDFGGERGCFIGRNCAPTHGLHCPINVQQ